MTFFVVSRERNFKQHRWRSLNFVARFYLDLGEIIHPQGHTRKAGSRSNCPKASVNPSYFFLVLGNDHRPFKPSKPTSWSFQGLSRALPLTNPFLGPRGILGPLSNWITILIYPCYFMALSVQVLKQKHLLRSHLDFYCSCQKVLLCLLVTTGHRPSRGIFLPPPSDNLVQSW